MGRSIIVLTVALLSTGMAWGQGVGGPSLGFEPPVSVNPYALDKDTADWHPAMAAAEDGTVIAVWHERDMQLTMPDVVPVISYSYDYGESWSLPKPLDIDASAIDDYTFRYNRWDERLLETDDEGAWVLYDRWYGVFLRSLDNGRTWSETGGGLPQNTLQQYRLHISDSGAWHVFWVEGVSGNPVASRLMHIHSTDKGTTWSEPEEAFRQERLTPYGEIAIASDSPEQLLLIEQREAESGSVGEALYARISTDSGDTWQQPVEVAAVGELEHLSLVSHGGGV